MSPASASSEAGVGDTAGGRGGLHEAVLSMGASGCRFAAVTEGKQSRCTIAANVCNFR
jgi:hypothetical protein